MSAAPYACSGVTTYGALQKLSDVYPAEPIFVIGAGGLGLMCLSILKALGGKGAVVVDIDERKRRAALECGALAAVDGKDPHVITEIARAAQGPVRGVVDPWAAPRPRPSASTSCRRAASSSSSDCLGVAHLGRCRSSHQGGDNPGQLCRQSPGVTQLVELARTGAVPAIPITRRPLEEASAALRTFARVSSSAALCSHRRRQPSLSAEPKRGIEFHRLGRPFVRPCSRSSTLSEPVRACSAHSSLSVSRRRLTKRVAYHEDDLDRVPLSYGRHPPDGHAAARGAQAQTNVQVHLLQAREAGPADVLNADGYIFATPENLAAMAGI